MICCPEGMILYLVTLPRSKICFPDQHFMTLPTKRMLSAMNQVADEMAWTTDLNDLADVLGLLPRNYTPFSKKIKSVSTP